MSHSLKKLGLFATLIGALVLSFNNCSLVGSGNGEPIGSLHTGGDLSDIQGDIGSKDFTRPFENHTCIQSNGQVVKSPRGIVKQILIDSATGYSYEYAPDKCSPQRLVDNSLIDLSQYLDLLAYGDEIFQFSNGTPRPFELMVTTWCYSRDDETNTEVVVDDIDGVKYISYYFTDRVDSSNNAVEFSVTSEFSEDTDQLIVRSSSLELSLIVQMGGPDAFPQRYNGELIKGLQPAKAMTCYHQQVR